MKPIILTPFTKKVEIEYTQNFVQLSPERKNEIEEFWVEINKHRSFHRGEIFHINSVIEQGDLCKIMLNRTDYAHYLYTVRNHATDEEGCKVVYGAGLVETKDSKFVFGEMGNHTAYPGRLQCVGGGLNCEDLKGNYFDIEESLLRELMEELGIDETKHIEKCTPVFIKKGGTYDFLVILYHIQLRILADELIENYQHYTEELLTKGEKPEFQDVIYIENNKEAITSFFKNDERYYEEYLKPFLERMADSK